MLTELRQFAKRMPPFRALVDERDELKREVASLREELARHTRWGEPSYDHDGLRTYHKSLGFLQDDCFMRAYAAGSRTGNKNSEPADIHIEYRAHIVCWAANHAKNLRGDFVECGVNRGFLAVTLCNYIDFNTTGKSFYLFDTFEGVPESQMSSNERKWAIEHTRNAYEECYEAAKRNFASFPRAELIRGRVPETLSQAQIESVCYLSIDMNIAVPELAAMEYFWDKLVPGAIVVLDDYGWRAHLEQKIALDSFVAKRGVEILTVPTGQGLLLKP